MQISSITHIDDVLQKISKNRIDPMLNSVAKISKDYPEASNVKITTVVTKIFKAKETTVLLQGERHRVFSGSRISTSSDLTFLISSLHFSQGTIRDNLLSNIRSQLSDSKSYHLEKVEFSVQVFNANDTSLAKVAFDDLDFNQTTPETSPMPCVIS